MVPVFTPPIPLSTGGVGPHFWPAVPATPLLLLFRRDLVEMRLFGRGLYGLLRGKGQGLGFRVRGLGLGRKRLKV